MTPRPLLLTLFTLLALTACGTRPIDDAGLSPSPLTAAAAWCDPVDPELLADPGDCPFTALCEPVSICDCASASCVAPTQVYTVPATSSASALFDTLAGLPAEAVSIVQVEPRGAGVYTSSAPVTITGTVYILGVPKSGQRPRWEGNLDGPLLSVVANGSLHIADLELHNGSLGQSAVSVQGGVFSASRAVISAGGSGLEVFGGRALLSSSFLFGDAALGVYDADGVHLSYVTALSLSLPIRCSQPGPITVVRSLLANTGDAEFACGVALEDTTLVAPYDLLSDPLFLDGSTADLHLRDTAAGEALFGTATWQLGDPDLDLDGDPIPAVSYPGADQPSW